MATAFRNACWARKTALLVQLTPPVPWMISQGTPPTPSRPETPSAFQEALANDPPYAGTLNGVPQEAG